MTEEIDIFAIDFDKIPASIVYRLSEFFFESKEKRIKKDVKNTGIIIKFENYQITISSIEDFRALKLYFKAKMFAI